MWFLSTYNMAYATNTKESCNVNEDLGQTNARSGLRGSDAGPAGRLRLGRRRRQDPAQLPELGQRADVQAVHRRVREGNPDIKIDFSYAPPTSEYISTLQTRLVGNQAPDVFIITSENRDDLIDNGYAKDLTDESFMKNISQANKDFVGRDGKTYGMSITSWASGIAYNKDLLKQVGYDEPPANWDDFLKLCKKLKNAGIEPFLEPNADEPSRFIDAFQGSILEKKGVDPTTLSTQDNQTPGTDGLEAVKEYIRLYDEGGVTRDTVGISGDDMKTQFTNGQVAMIVDGAWDFATFEQAGMNWDFAPMPKLGDDYTQYAQGSASRGGRSTRSSTATSSRPPRSSSTLPVKQVGAAEA